MRQFILRARKGPTSPDFDLNDLSRAGRMEIVAGCVRDALFCAGRLRTATTIHVVLDGPKDPPKTVRFDSDRLGSLSGFDERSLAGELQDSLRACTGLQLGEEAQAPNGVFVRKIGFETLLKETAAHHSLYTLDRRGQDIRSAQIDEHAAFVLSDHLHMPPKSARFLDRLAAERISLGPKPLFASQCVVLVNNELDRRAPRDG